MIHRGEIIKKVVEESGMPLTVICDRLKISRGTIYNKFDDPNLDWDFIIDLGKVLRIDIIKLKFSNKIDPSIANEDSPEYTSLLDKYKSELHEVKTKYISLLEKYQAILEKDVDPANMPVKKTSKSDYPEEDE